MAGPSARPSFFKAARIFLSGLAGAMPDGGRRSPSASGPHLASSPPTIRSEDAMDVDFGIGKETA